MLHRAIVLTVIALVLFVFLLFVTGRKPEDEDVHLVTIDRLPVEVNVLCFWAVLGTAGGLNLALMGELLNGTNDMSILLVPSILFFVAAFAFALELTLSLVRVIKNRSFVKQCWSIRFILWCWRTFIKVCKCIRQSFGKLRRMLFRDYKTRNVVLLFTAYSIVLAFLAAVFGGVGGSFFVFVFGTVWFLAAGYFLIKRITGFERIVDALRRLRAGDLGFKLTDMPKGVFAEMAEDINSLGDGMQAALQNEVRAERMKSELITNVSHDLKTPLTSIMGYAEIIAGGIAKPEDVAPFAGKIRTEAQRLLALIEDIIHLSRLDEGGETVSFEPVELSALCDTVRDRLQSKAAGKGIALRIEGEPAAVSGQRRTLEQMIFNLTDNAINYNKPQGRVTLVTGTENGRPFVQVADTGIGIAPADQQRVFERFYRVDKSHSKMTGGTGLGLSIVKHGAALHRAEVELKSVLGEGTCITLRFPKE